MVQWLRWLAVIPAAFAGWLLAFVAVAGVHRLLLVLCPVESIVSGTCEADWFRSAESILMFCFSALAAVLVVVLPTLIAPSRRRAVAVLALIGGAACAVWLGIRADALPPSHSERHRRRYHGRVRTA